MSGKMIPIEYCEVISDSEMKAIRDYIGENIEHLYWFQDRPIVPFVYFEDFLWIHLFEGSVDHFKQMRLKELIEQSKKYIEKNLKERNYPQLFSRCEKIIKIEMYLKYFHKIPEQDKYDIFRSVYRSSEYNFHQLNTGFLSEVFSYRSFSKDWSQCMDVLKGKADSKGMLTIYRGMGSRSTPLTEALSWSLSKETASFFANRFGEGQVWKANIHINDVYDYFGERGEEEVLVSYESISNIKQVD